MCGSRRRRSRRWNSSLTPAIVPQGRHTVTPSQNVGKDRDLIENWDSVYCFSCQYSKNPDKAKYCGNCGEELHSCPISKMTFRVGDDFGQCPQCRTVFHLHHLELSLERKSVCPYCQAKLSGINVGEIGTHNVKM